MLGSDQGLRCLKEMQAIENTKIATSCSCTEETFDGRFQVKITRMKKPFALGLRLFACILMTASLLACSQNQAPQTRFELLDQTALTTADLRGKVTLVNFWATSCTTCVAEMPQIIETYEKFKGRGFETLAVAMDYDPPEYVQNFARSRQLPFMVALDRSGDAAKAWGDVKLTPTTYIVNKRGEIVKRYIGAPNFDDLHALIEKLLKQA